MAKAIKHRRGTTEEHSTFVGLEGEITVDTTKKTLVVHDQETVGGFPLARESIVTNLDTRVETLENKATQAETAIESKINKEEAEQTFVHKNGNEIIEGTKTFTGDVSFVTPEQGNSSTKPATTEWVSLVATQLVNDIMLRTTPAQAAHAAMPSGRAISLVMPSTGGTFTAPSDGWIVIRGHKTSNIPAFIAIYNDTTYVLLTSPTTFGDVGGLVPVHAGEILSVGYGGVEYWISFKFIYAEGAY